MLEVVWHLKTKVREIAPEDFEDYRQTQTKISDDLSWYYDLTRTPKATDNLRDFFKDMSDDITGLWKKIDKEAIAGKSP